MKFVLFLLSIAAFAQTSRIEGRVVTPEGKPVPKANIRLQGNGSRGNPQPKNYVDVAARDGSFSLEGVEPGTYMPSAQLNGYVQPNQLANGRRPSPITVVAGENRKGIEIILTPLGIVSGSVLDSEGDPVANVQVTLLRYVYNQGHTSLQQMSGSSSDDRGQFRMVNVQPGRYYVRANSNNVQNVNPNDVRGPRAMEANLPTFYPASADTRGATRIDVGAMPIENLQVRLRRGRTYTVRGRVEGAAPQPGSTQTYVPYVNIMPRSSEGVQLSIGTNTKPNGLFEALAVPPGEYTLVAQLNEPAADGTQKRRVARTDVIVGAGDVENVVLRLSEGFEITGHFRAEDGTNWEQFMHPPASRDGGVTRGEVMIMTSSGPGQRQPPYLNLMPASDAYNYTSPQFTVNSDGTFSAKAVEAGRYLLNVSGFPNGGYIKSVSFGGRDASRQALDITGGGELELVISTKSGSLSLSWPSRLPEPKDGDPQTMAVIWPATPDFSSANSGVLTTSLNPKARIRTQPLPPGDYYVATLEEIPSQDVIRIPDFLARFNSKATRVTVKEGDTPVEPAVIPRDAILKAYEEFP